jgi:hypothetical protein
MLWMLGALFQTFAEADFISTAPLTFLQQVNVKIAEDNPGANFISWVKFVLQQRVTFRNGEV